VSISETLITNGNDDIKAILIHQVAEKLIEVQGVKADSLMVNYGGHDQSIFSPIQNLSKFTETIVQNVPADLRDQTWNFFKKLFMYTLQQGHGTLACVIANKRRIPKKLNDGIQLTTKLDITKSIKDLTEKNDLQANSVLEGNFSLISGMLQSDGITLFSDAGEVLSYNVFVKHPSKLVNSKTSGGARSRTFLTLSRMVGNELISAYIQSQDGQIDYKR
jgi:hypothetical protein